MTDRDNTPRSAVPRKLDMRVIAAVHGIAAVVVAAFFVTQHLMRYWDRMHLLSLQLEGLCWIVPICLLLAVSYGLWSQLAWARLLTLVLDWSIFVGALGIAVVFAVTIVVWVPGNGFDLSTALMATSMLVLLPVVLVSAATLWGLHRGFGGINAGIAIVIILFAVLAEVAATWFAYTRWSGH